MDLASLEVLPIHKHSEYMTQCCQLINDEWPRSETARMTSLKSSCDKLPTSLILLTPAKIVIGHCKLTAIPSLPESCFIESVVINKALRGKKLGTYLMTKAEEYCKYILLLKTVHLSTKGQEEFYAKLGYEPCAPVSIYGSFFPLNNKCNSISHKDDPTKILNNCYDSATKPNQPPPPPPMPKLDIQIINNVQINKTFMFKYL